MLVGSLLIYCASLRLIPFVLGRNKSRGGEGKPPCSDQLLPRLTPRIPTTISSAAPRQLIPCSCVHVIPSLDLAYGANTPPTRVASCPMSVTRRNINGRAFRLRNDYVFDIPAVLSPVSSIQPDSVCGAH